MSPSTQEKLKAQRDERRRRLRLAEARAERARQDRDAERDAVMRRQATQRAHEERRAEEARRARLDQVRESRRAEGEAAERLEKLDAERRLRLRAEKRARRLAERRKGRLLESREARRQDEQRDRRQKDQRRQLRREATRAQGLEELREKRRGEQAREQRDSQGEKQARGRRVSSRDGRRRLRHAERRRMRRGEIQEPLAARGQGARRRQRRKEGASAERPSAPREAPLDKRRSQRRQGRIEGARSAERLAAKRDERRIESQRARREAAIRGASLEGQRSDRRAADEARERAETLRAREVERRRNDRGSLNAARRRRADRRAAALSARDQQSPAEEAPSILLWLRTRKNRLIDENDEVIYLRGVNVTGLDNAEPGADQRLGAALALDEAGVSVLTDLWGVNIVRLPFSAQTVLDGTGALTASALLAELDQIVAALAQMGVYTLLALTPHVTEGVTPLPDEDVYQCWRLLSSHYQDEPGVLYEIYAASPPLAAGWPDAANRLIGAIRREHPASLIFVCGSGAGANTEGLPLRFSTGQPAPNLVYTLRFTPRQSPASADPRFRGFAQSFPVFASEWSDTGADLGRSSEAAGLLFDRYGIGWTAANWNAEPRLVHNAAARNFTETRFGRLVRRTLASPLPPNLTPFPLV